MSKLQRKWVTQQKNEKKRKRKGNATSLCSPSSTWKSTQVEKIPRGRADILVWPLEQPKVLRLLLLHPQIKANHQTNKQNPRVSPLPKMFSPQLTSPASSCHHVRLVVRTEHHWCPFPSGSGSRVTWTHSPARGWEGDLEEDQAAPSVSWYLRNNT